VRSLSQISTQPPAPLGLARSLAQAPDFFGLKEVNGASAVFDQDVSNPVDLIALRVACAYERAPCTRLLAVVGAQGGNSPGEGVLDGVHEAGEAALVKFTLLVDLQLLQSRYGRLDKQVIIREPGISEELRALPGCLQVGDRADHPIRQLEAPARGRWKL
jgi:hypothetical protein